MKKLTQHIIRLFFIGWLGFFSIASSFAQDGFIKGRVSDESGVLPGINIFIDGPASTIVLTDMDGSYTAKVLPGKYTVSVEVMGYGEQKQNVTVRAGQTSIADFELSLNVGGVTASATLIEQSTLDAPATIVVVSEDQIYNRGYRNLQDVLDDIPEVEIQKKSMPEFRDNTVLRGIAGNEKFIVFMDGIRISSGTADPHAIYTNYPMANVERVEVLIGPASAIYGVDAYSGVINIITKDGAEVDGLTATASYGLYGTTENNITIGGSVNDISYVIGGSFFQSSEADFNNLYADDFRWHNENYANDGEVRSSFFTGDEKIISDENRSFQMGSSAYSINARVNFGDFEVGFFQNQETHSSSLSIEPEYSLYNDASQFGVGIRSIFGRHTYTSEEENLIIRSTVSSNTTETSRNSAFANVYTNYETGYRYQNSLVNRISEQVTWLINENSSLVAGASFEDITALPRTGDLPFQIDKSTSLTSQGQYYFGTNVQDLNGKDLTVQQDFYNLQYFNTGGFVQFQAKLADGLLEFTGGARYDYNTRYGGAFNPRAGLLVKPTEQLRFKLLYGQAFLSPSPWKAYQHFGRFTQVTNSAGEVTGLFAPFLHLPNPDLQPENLQTFEFQTSYSLNNLFVLSLNGFYNISTNFIDYYAQDVTRTSFKGVNAAYVETPQNIGTATTFGGSAKLDGTISMDRFKIDFFGYYTYLDGDLEGGQLLYAAKHTGKIGLTFSNDRFAITPRVLLRSESYSPILDQNEQNISNDAFIMVNLFARFIAVNTDELKLSIFGDVRNVLDERFYHISNNGPEGMILAPQDPLMVKGGIDIKF